MTITRHVCHGSLVVVLSVLSNATSFAQIFNGGADKASSSGEQIHQDSAVQQAGWPSIPLPKISMPKVTMPDMSVVTRPVKAGFNKVTSGTKKAWEGTKEIFTFGKGGSNASTSTQSPQPKQSFWGRMFSSEPEPQDGPQTVGEWMSQPRLNP